MNEIVLQSFDDFNWDDSFKERIYDNEDFKSNPKLFLELFVKWLNSLSNKDKIRFTEKYQDISTLETTMVDGCFTYFVEFIFKGVIFKNVTSNVRMPDGSYHKEITFLLNT